MEMDDQGGNEALHYLSSISEIVKGCAEIGGEIKKERMARRAGELIKNLLGLYLDRRVQSPLLNQTRPSLQGGKSQHMQQRWRSKGYRCIGGVMYQVSANKLSKTSSTPGRGRDLSAKSPGRAGEQQEFVLICIHNLALSAVALYPQSWLLSVQLPEQISDEPIHCQPCRSAEFGHHSSSQAEEKEEGILFLRGTCKKTDGTCSFSHKVSKDKMPVCSYFLKGICNNSNCPYSHVYVSRKAEICQDFLKGYCPMGEKCKKKHTLVCPDFAKKGSCPRGAQCKLLHPQKKRHPREAEDGGKSDPPAKWRRLGEETGRNDPAQLHDDGEMPGPSSTEQEVKFWKKANTSPTSWLRKLPSFISLQSSSSPGDQACKEEKDEDELEDEQDRGHNHEEGKCLFLTPNSNDRAEIRKFQAGKNIWIDAKRDQLENPERSQHPSGV
ncbi:hypothetical protein Q9233_016133 [Columba guinea]|nr:hypothetical protein Q9233_016133 [Columba guinea]